MWEHKFETIGTKEIKRQHTMVRFLVVFNILFFAFYKGY